MNHVITLGDLLRALTTLAGVVVVIVGVVIFLGGAFANVETGESDGGKCKRGVAVIIAGAIIVAAILLAGCASAPIQTRTVTIDRPVAIQPITKAQIPPLPGQLGPRPRDARDGEAVALAGRCDAIAFVRRAWPLLLLSAGLPPAQAPSFPECENKP